MYIPVNLFNAYGLYHFHNTCTMSCNYVCISALFFTSTGHYLYLIYLFIDPLCSLREREREREREGTERDELGEREKLMCL